MCFCHKQRVAILHKCKTHTKRTGNVSFCFTKTQLVEKPISQIKVHKNKSFRPPFSKGGGFQRQSLGRSPLNCEISYTYKRSGGEPKQSGGLFWRGEPYQGVPPKKFDFVQSDNSGVLFRQTEFLFHKNNG